MADRQRPFIGNCCASNSSSGFGARWWKART